MDNVLISLVKSFGENEIFVTNVIIAAVNSLRAQCIYIKNLFYINERLINFLVAGQMYHFHVLLFAQALLLLQILTYGILTFILKLLFYLCIFEFSVCGLELKHDVVVVMRLLWLQLLQRKKIVSFPFIYIWAQHLLYK
jgi:hypothetical protein